MASPQNVELRDSEGNVVGQGTFRAEVSGYQDGQANGQAELDVADEHGSVKTLIHWDEWEETQDGAVVLNGRGQATFQDGQTETFPATATVRGDLDGMLYT